MARVIIKDVLFAIIINIKIMKKLIKSKEFIVTVIGGLVVLAIASMSTVLMAYVNKINFSDAFLKFRDSLSFF